MLLEAADMSGKMIMAAALCRSLPCTVTWEGSKVPFPQIFMKRYRLIHDHNEAQTKRERETHLRKEKEAPVQHKWPHYYKLLLSQRFRGLRFSPNSLAIRKTHSL